MNKILLVSLIFAVLSSCTNKTIKDPKEYNSRISSLVIQVQNPLDSIEGYLLNLKFKLELDTSKIYSAENDFDAETIDFLLNRTQEKIDFAKDEIINIEFISGDTDFKPAVEKFIPQIENSLKNDFIPLIDILKNSINKKNRDILKEISPYGKSGFVNYQSAMDSIVVGQLKFNAKNKYIINEHLLRFNF
ncbi:MAG: hypothetical protein JXL97_18625 [Bacteroidales bacterium]|nr:hypothetical protein [Bacteroidales bacterium]